ncbi:MAG: hypothetical protein WC080_00755 [Patescibacteria group bacterium]
MINFESIIKRSFNLIKKYKYLWFLGLLSGGFSFGSNQINYLFDNNAQPDYQRLKELVPNNGTIASLARAEVKDAGKALVDSMGPQIFDSIYIWVGIMILAIVLVAALIYISLASRGALIRAIPKLDDGKDLRLKDSWLLGHKLFWRRLSLSVIWFFIIILPFLVLLIPIIMLLIYEMKTLAIVFGILFGLVFIFYTIYLALIFPVVERALFLENLPADKAIAVGRKYFNKNWQHFVLSYLIVFGFCIGLGIAIAIVTTLLGLFVVGIGYLLYIVAHFLGIAFWIIFGCAALVVFLIISGITSGFFSSILTLTYKDLRARGR